MAESTIAPTREVDAEALSSAAVDWLRHQFQASGADTFVLGLSGGIDSAVVCGLASRAVGPDKVIGVIMPSSSNPDDAVQAGKVATAFGVRTITIDLTLLTTTFQTIMPSQPALNALGLIDADAPDLESRARLATANTRPRLRMTTLYYVANLVRGMVLGTGNRSEAMIGYFTKYGDGGVDLFPLIGFFKYQVRAIAAHIGVPQSVIDRPPSAGLWQGQTDEDEIGLTYDVLDATLEAIVAGDTSGVDPGVLAKVQGMIAASEHKRRPVPAFDPSGIVGG